MSTHSVIIAGSRIPGMKNPAEAGFTGKPGRGSSAANISRSGCDHIGPTGCSLLYGRAVHYDLDTDQALPVIVRILRGEVKRTCIRTETLGMGQLDVIFLDARAVGIRIREVRCLVPEKTRDLIRDRMRLLLSAPLQCEKCKATHQ